MTRIAYFQPFSGASGDMILGALIDAGLPLAALDEGLRGLAVGGYALRAERVLRGALACTRLRVLLEELPPARELHEASRGHSREPSHSHSHGHSHEGSGEHSHEHSHEPSRGRSGDPSGDPSPEGHRSLGDILRILQESRLPAAVRERAGAVFRRLAEAEARVHGTSVEDIHFHEVGAVDAIVDITGTCIGLDWLGIDEVHSAPVTVGTGSIDVAHGRLPLPAPATLELLRGFPLLQVDSGTELTTPTGAALLTTLAGSFCTMPAMRLAAVGYGAGDDRAGPVPNALRVLIGERTPPGAGRDRVLLLETNLDDMSSEWISHLMDRLFAAGALDVYVTPIFMKKTRPAHQVTVLAPLAKEEQVSAVLFQESTTFGVRRYEVERMVLERTLHTVTTPWGDVRVKAGTHQGKETSAAPEYEDLRRAAEKSGLPIKEVHRRVLDLYHGGGNRS